MARTIFTQKAQSASKNNQPRAWRPLLSVNSEVSEIMVCTAMLRFRTSKNQSSHRIPGRVRCGRCSAEPFSRLFCGRSRAG